MRDTPEPGPPQEDDAFAREAFAQEQRRKETDDRIRMAKLVREGMYGARVLSEAIAATADPLFPADAVIAAWAAVDAYVKDEERLR